MEPLYWMIDNRIETNLDVLYSVVFSIKSVENVLYNMIPPITTGIGLKPLQSLPRSARYNR